MEFDAVTDSGVREEFATGSRRDSRDGKGRYDLIPPIPMKRLARHYENGAKKYRRDDEMYLEDVLESLDGWCTCWEQKWSAATKSEESTLADSAKAATRLISEDGITTTLSDIATGRSNLITRPSFYGTGYQNGTRGGYSTNSADAARFVASVLALKSDPTLTMITPPDNSVDSCAESATPGSVCWETLETTLSEHSDTCALRKHFRFSKTRRGMVRVTESINNWEKGQELSRYLDSAERHLYAVKCGDESEDHAIAVVWNMFAFIHTQEMIRMGKLPETLDDYRDGVEQYR